MKTANHRHSLGLGLMVFTLAILLSVVPGSVSASTGAAAPQAYAPDLLTGITLDGSFDDADTAYLKASLQLLYTRLPAWYDYLEQAKPLVLSVDATRSAAGIVAFAECCDAQGAGAITFGYHFGTFAVSNEPDAQSMQAREIAFLGYFVHEATHVRDQRAGRLPKKMDPTVCISGEKAALEQVLNFKRAVVAVRIADNPAVDQVYRLTAQAQVNAEAGNLNDERYWDRYCGACGQPKTTNGTDVAMARINP